MQNQIGTIILVLLIILKGWCLPNGLNPLVRLKRPRGMIGKETSDALIMKETNDSNSSATPKKSLLPREFPNDILPTINSDKCNMDIPICSNPADYPQRLMDAVVEANPFNMLKIFENDLLPRSAHTSAIEEEESFLCESSERLIHPRSGLTPNNDTVLIINTSQFHQAVRVEMCSNPGGTCRQLANFLFRTECKQIYMTRTLLAVNITTNEPYKESFRLPSCCKCVIKWRN